MAPATAGSSKGAEAQGALDFPREKEPLGDNERGMPRLDMPTCVSCTACALICPNRTITMVKVATGRGDRLMPQINLERCLFCGLCEEVCPTKCLALTKGHDFGEHDRRRFVRRPEELQG